MAGLKVNLTVVEGPEKGKSFSFTHCSSLTYRTNHSYPSLTKEGSKKSSPPILGGVAEPEVGVLSRPGW